jgi:FAD/FMN-containing dehydrogenase
VQPRNAKEVATSMTALLGADKAGDWHIAIRSGGHNSGGANNIDNGVTIDLMHLDQATYDKETNLASVGPGAKWMDVYAKLAKHDVLVTGGRDGDVGVGGFLLGGGSTFFMGTEGFGCDAVKNYEIVLTNGTIVNANDKENSDLWLALKGGGSNFGIVTRYDMEALPNTKLSYKLRSINITHALQIASDFVDFTDNYEKFTSDALVLYLTHNATIIKESMVGTIQVNTQGKINSTGFAKLDKIPDIKPAPYEHVTLAEAAAGSQVAGGVWYVSINFPVNPNSVLTSCSIQDV